MSGPIPARVDSAAKTILLDLIDDAVKAGWTLARICGVGLPLTSRDRVRMVSDHR